MSCNFNRADMIGSSAVMGELREIVQRVAATPTTVLIIGESGSGKELVAQRLHHLSPRNARPFVAVNCGALPPSLVETELFGHERGSFTGAGRTHAGVFERAEDGTLFLDEITEMPMALQTRLLRVLESRSYYRVGGSEEIPTRARIVAATNRNPLEAVRDGSLREDLLYRLAVFPILVPPLRARGADALEIAQQLLQRLNRDAGTNRRLSAASVEFLHRHPWPGNVRELRNAVERGYLLANQDIELAPTLDVLGDFAASSSGLGSVGVGSVGLGLVRVEIGTPLQQVERMVIEATLAHVGGNKPRAAQTLGCSLKTLYNKLQTYAQGPQARSV
jgi:DNA-binding NtrC family response regulator